MKQLLVLLMLLCSTVAFAQDVIVQKDGSTILSKVIEVGTEEVKYKKYSNQNGPTYSIIKTDVLSINYENGDKDTFDKPEPLSEKNNPRQESTGGTISEELKLANESFITQCNLITPVWKTPQEMKKAKYIFNVLKIEEGSVFENDDVKQTISIGQIDWRKNHWGELVTADPKYEKMVDMYHNYVLAVKIFNKTDKTMFIDLGSSFITRGDEAQPYYTPSATSTTHGASSGASVNMGAVAGALGVGGSLGTLANGVNVGGGTSNSSTTIEYSQRVIAIPPKSAKSLEPQFLFVGGGKGMPQTEVTDRSDKKNWMISVKSLYKNLQVGDIIHWKKEDESIKLSFHLSYAFDESCSLSNQLNVGFYTSETYGIRTKMKAMTTDYVIDDLEGWQNVPYKFFLRNDPSDGIDVSNLNVEHTGK